MARKTATPAAATRLFDRLAEEGFRPKLEVDDETHSTISFKVEGRHFLSFVDEEDPGFFHLGLCYELPEGMTLPWALDRANALNEELKAAKVTVRAEEREIRFHIELFVDGAPAPDLLERSVSVLRLASKKFFATERPVPEERLNS